MPTVTSSRLSLRQRQFSFSFKGVTYSPFADLGVSYSDKPTSPMQVTTSFRTGGKFAYLEGEQLRTSGSSWAEGTRAALSDSDRDAIIRPKSRKFDIGHPFHTSDSWYDGFSHPEHQHLSYSSVLLPRTHMQDGSGGNMRDALAIPTQKSLSAVGVQGIRDTLPDKSPAALAQALIELKREGLPRISGVINDMLSRNGKSVAKGVGSAHLGTEFGIKPLLRDFQSAMQVVRNGEELLEKYKQGAGKRQHRQRTWPTRTYTSSHATTRYTGVCRFGGQLAYEMGLMSVSGVRTTTERTVEVTDRFKGAYVYYLPEMKQSQETKTFMRDFSYLTGMDMSYTLLWELAPWSWLSDWIFNFGDNLAVAEALREDGLVLQYGYMMRETRYKCVRTVHGLRSSSGHQLGPVSVTFNRVTKERIRATPYGFGLNTAGFTARQWSILGALGLTKGSNSLRYSD